MRVDVGVLCLFILLLAVLAVWNTTDMRGSERDHYCEMRAIHDDSAGRYGWPADAHGKFEDGDCYE